MARLRVGDGMLHLELSGWERVFGMHGDIAVPLSAVTEVAYVDDPWRHMRGIRAPGTGFPYVIMLGTTRYKGVKDFNAVYGRSPATIVTLTGSQYARLVVTRPPSELALPAMH